MEQKIIKTGNSLAVTIPSIMVKTLGLRPGQPVNTLVDISQGTLTHSFPHTGQLPLFKKVKSS
jgi:antitoxin component of MazEF toxin-antitoxin module